MVAVDWDKEITVQCRLQYTDNNNQTKSQPRQEAISDQQHYASTRAID